MEHRKRQAKGALGRVGAALAAIGLTASLAGAQTVWTVNTVVDQNDLNPGDGICDCDPAAGNQCSLRAAIEEACYGGGFHRILLGAQVYVLTVIGTEHVSGRFGDLDLFGTVLTRLEIRGVGAASTFIDGSGLFAGGGPERVLHVTSGVNANLDVELQDLTISGARQPGRGGAILHEGGRDLALVDVDLVSNHAQNGGALWTDRSATLTSVYVGGNDTSLSPIGDGGGILVDGGALSATGLVLDTNDASRHGGGLALLSGASATLSGSTIEFDTAEDGGGAYVSGSLTLDDCTAIWNVASPGGGGAVNGFSGTVTARRTLFEHNNASTGGALQTSAAMVLDLTECNVRSNQATGFGGVVAGGPARIVATSINFNEATTSSGGGLTSLGMLEVLNSTISTNRAPNGSGGGLYLSGGGPKSVSATTVAHNIALSGAGIWSGTAWGVTGTLIGGNFDMNALPANNAGPGVASSAGRNLDSDGTCGFPPFGCDISGTLATPIDPRIQPLLANGGFGETNALEPDSPALHRGASFDLAGNAIAVDQRGVPRTPAPDVGAFEGSPEIGSFCDATDNALPVCPCGNPGLPDTGCDNAQGTGGVRIEVTSLSCPPTQVTITATGFPPAGAPTAILFRSNNLNAAPIVFGDGLRCVGTLGLVRLAATTALGGTATHLFGHGAGVGTFYYQDWYRNTPGTFCTPSAFNLSNGQTIVFP